MTTTSPLSLPSTLGACLAHLVDDGRMKVHRGGHDGRVDARRGGPSSSQTGATPGASFAATTALSTMRGASLTSTHAR